jgi:hypothetical protein
MASFSYGAGILLICSKPSSTVKTAPHLGHLIFASFCTPHPKEKTAKIANAMMMLTHFLINPHLLS